MSQQINLFNPAFRRQEKHFSASALAASLALLAVFVGAAYAFQLHYNRSLEQVLAESDRQLVLRRNQILALAKEIAARDGDKSAAAQLALVEERLQMRRSLLQDVRTGAGGSAGGFSAHLTALARRTMPGGWLTGIEFGRGNDLVLRGRVLQGELVPAYIRQLHMEDPFSGRTVRELRLEAKEAPPAAPAPSRYVEFVMSMPL